MTPIQRVAFDDEIAMARMLFADHKLEASFHHLERAHIIGQAGVVTHLTTHWLMLGIEIRRRRAWAALGQVARIILGTIGSAVGVIPVGNTGGTDVSMFKAMVIDADLQRILDGAPSTAPD